MTNEIQIGSSRTPELASPAIGSARSPESAPALIGSEREHVEFDPEVFAPLSMFPDDESENDRG